MKRIRRYIHGNWWWMVLALIGVLLVVGQLTKSAAAEQPRSGLVHERTHIKMGGGS